ncbi:D-aminoacyl-tRNA deacylase, partial [Camellia lanceoleosa]
VLPYSPFFSILFHCRKVLDNFFSSCSLCFAQLAWEGLGLGGGAAVGDWSRNNGQNKIVLGIGGGHYAPRHMDIVLASMEQIP